MSESNSGLVVVLGILLTVTLAAGNVVFAAHATLLDPGFAADAIEEESGYDALTEQFQSAVAAQTEGSADGGSPVFDLVGEDPVAQAVTPAYVESQIGTNIDSFYAYLHGNSDRLSLSLDVAPLVDNVGDVFERSIANATTAELLDTAEGDPLGDLPVDQSTVEQLDQGPDAYESAQAEVRSEVRPEVLDTSVQQTYEEWSNDRLLALVIPDYDPQDYSESEKEQMVADRESEIKSALRTYIQEEQSAELQSSVDDELSAIADEETGEDVATDEPALQAPLNDLRDTTVLALTGQIDHGTYQQRATSAKADLGAAAGDLAESQVAEETGGQIDLNEAMGMQARPDFGGARTAVDVADTLAFVLPLLALVLVGAVAHLTRSAGRTLGTVGWSMAWAGIPAFVGATVLSSQLPSMLNVGANPDAVQSMTLGVMEQSLGHASLQSLALGGLGVVLIGVALAFKYGYMERFTGESVETAQGAPVQTGGQGDPLADRGGPDQPRGGGQQGAGGTTRRPPQQDNTGYAGRPPGRGQQGGGQPDAGPTGDPLADENADRDTAGDPLAESDDSDASEDPLAEDDTQTDSTDSDAEQHEDR